MVCYGESVRYLPDRIKENYLLIGRVIIRDSQRHLYCDAKDRSTVVCSTLHKLQFPSPLLSYYNMIFCQEYWDNKRERTSFGE